MRWWQWAIVGAVIWLVAVAWVIAFLRGAHWEDEQ